jgi:hypothetical protein
VSQVATSIKTSNETITNYANEERNQFSSKLRVASEFKGRKIVEFAKKISVSLDVDVNRVLKQSGSTQHGSEIITSFAVNRLIEMEIPDFSGKKNFVTFNPIFGMNIRSYLEESDSNKKFALAKNLFSTYGMLVFERGIFGGYREARAVVTQSDIERYRYKKADINVCFEAAVSGSTKAPFGLQAESNYSLSVCNENNKEEMEELRSKFFSSSATEEITGGRLIDSPQGNKQFVVEASDVVALKRKQYYRSDDLVGLKLRPITDFLNPQKIHPLEFGRLQITEEEFLQIKDDLEIHMLDALAQTGQKLDACNTTDSNCAYTYFENNAENGDLNYDNLNCRCFSPFLVDSPLNIALYKPTSQSSNFYSLPLGNGTSINAVDKRLTGNIALTQREKKPFWQVNLKHMYFIQKIIVYIPSGQYMNHMQNFQVKVIDDSGVVVWSGRQNNALKNKHEFVVPSDRDPGCIVEISLPGSQQNNGKKHLSLQEVEVYGEPLPLNVALKKPATQSSDYDSGRKASKGVDGDSSPTSNGITQTKQETDPWWKVHLQSSYIIQWIKIYVRSDCCKERTQGFIVELYDQGNLTQHYPPNYDQNTLVQIPVDNHYATEVIVRLEGDNRILSLQEVEVYGIPNYNYQFIPFLPDYVLKVNLLGWWDFESGFGNDALQQNDFLGYGARIVSDRQGYNGGAVELNGATQYMEIPIPTFQFNATSEFTLSIWVKTPADGGGLVLYHGPTGRKDYIWLIGASTESKIFGHQHHLYPSWAISRYEHTYNETWFHIIARKIVLFGTPFLTLIINGQLTRTYNADDIESGTTSILPLRLGRGRDLKDGYFRGRIDDMGLWEKGLNRNEICSLFVGQNFGDSYDNCVSRYCDRFSFPIPCLT